jgi:signal transduction histidine kinase
VNNPLGGMLNAVRMIQRHGDDPTQREKAASLLERGLNGIRNVVKASLDVWRGRADLSDISGSDVEDLRFLVESEAERRKLVLEWENNLTNSVPVRAQSIRQIALNLLLNACQASPVAGTVRFRCSISEDALKMEIQDGGPGLPEDQLAILSGESQLSIPTSGGLGIWTVTRLVSELGGKISVDARQGTRIEVKVPYHASISAIPTAA